jgi:CRISPR-associated protein Cas2
MLTVIAYDVTDDRRRTRISNFLEDYGTRVNYSVFECELNSEEFEQLQARLTDLMDTHEDRIVFYRLCEGCRVRRSAIGTRQKDTEDKGVVVIG